MCVCVCGGGEGGCIHCFGTLGWFLSPLIFSAMSFDCIEHNMCT